MNVSLTPELEELINAKVRSGLYHSASEVVREALRLMQERDAHRENRLADLQHEISIGLNEADNGELSPLDTEDIKAKGRLHFAQRQGRK